MQEQRPKLKGLLCFVHRDVNKKKAFLIYTQGDMIMKTKKRLITMVLLLTIALPAYALACTSGNNYRTSTGVVTKIEAKQMTQKYLASIDGAKLQPGEIMLDGRTYLVDVVDESGKSVVKMNIDMLTGDMRPVF